APMGGAVRMLCGHGEAALARALILEGRFRELEGLGLRHRYIEKVLGQAAAAPPKRPPEAGDLAWLEAQPQRLHGALHERAVAERILGRSLADAGALRVELETLQRKSAEGPVSDRVLRRIENLKGRLAAPEPPLPAILAKAELRLRRAAQRARLRAWQEALE